MSNKKFGFLILGIAISFFSTILTGYIFFGSMIFDKTMSPVQILLNAIGGVLFFNTLKYFNLKIALPVLLLILILICLLYTNAVTFNSVLRDTLFFFNVGLTMYVYYRFIMNNYNWIVRTLLLTIMFGISETIFLSGIQYFYWVYIRGVVIENLGLHYEYVLGSISGFGLGIGIEISNFIILKFANTSIIKCANCNLEVELNESEILKDKFICPNCSTENILK